MYPRSFLSEDMELPWRKNFVKSVTKQYGNPDLHAFKFFIYRDIKFLNFDPSTVEDPYLPVFLPSLYYIMYQYICLVTTYSHQLSGFSTNWDFPRLSTNTYSSRFYENTLPNKKLNFWLMFLLTFVKTSINTSRCVYSKRNASNHRSRRKLCSNFV